jgi:hypothetical protein
MEWHQSLARFAWPAAFVAAGALTFTYMSQGRDIAAGSASVIKVKSTATVVRDLQDVAKLESLSMHVEKVVDVADHQKVLFGTIAAEDNVLFVASGEAVLGVDLSKLRDEDVTFDVHTKTATVRLPPIETFHARLDEEHSYVHSRKTGVLATRNEALEGEARRQAVAAFEQAAGDGAMRERAKDQAERSLKALAHSFGVESIAFEWRTSPTEI